mgnify:CR=1 FL=1
MTLPSLLINKQNVTQTVTYSQGTEREKTPYGHDKNNFKIIISRKLAIEEALMNMSSEFKIILILGKGHDSEQILKNYQSVKFNDISFSKKIIEYIDKNF